MAVTNSISNIQNPNPSLSLHIHNMDSEEDQQSSPPPPSSPSDKYLLGFLIANIVGRKHCPGNINGREMVGLIREPFNPHDPNAIKVLNSATSLIGYIERPVAAVLSPLIDTLLVTVEAIVPSATSRLPSSAHRLPCQIHLFAHFHNFDAVAHAVSQGNLHLITPSDPSFTLSDAVAVKETRRPKRSKSVNAIFKLVHNNNTNARPLGTLNPPSNIVKTELFCHQQEGLAWLFHRENSGELPPFWEEKDGYFANILTDFQTRNRPEPMRGGILADAMGLGKTLTLLSLIALDKENESGTSEMSRTPRNVVASHKRKREDGIYDKTKATLVVCTPSVISTWITQLEEHTLPGSLKTYIYYGDRRTKSVDELKKYDLVLTTYSTLSTDKSDMPAKNMEWRRIVLDEAHTIRNSNAQQSETVIKLNGERRWAVTGTPIQNGCIDLFSLMAFLRFQPFMVRSCWKAYVQGPLNQGKKEGLSRLQVLMGAIALRRTKDEGLVWLPPKTIETCYVELSLEERELYDQVKRKLKTLLHLYGLDHEVGLVPHYSTVISTILRLRQICTDLKLCPSDHKSLLPSYDIEDVSNNPELLQKLLLLMQDGEDFDCPICMSPPTEIVITCCAHIFCLDCILRVVKQNQPCPLCRNPITESDLFSAPESSKTDSSVGLPSSETGLSSKASTLIKLLKESREKHPAAKSVVFSQFCKMLSLLEKPLNAAGFKTLHLDGKMNAKHRAKVIDKFQVQGGDAPVVLLASLRASSAGINLTAASSVYFMEPWWNHAVEEQAMDRVHRIGQKEAVKVVRLIARNSIEEKILMLQEKRKQLGRESKDVGMGINDLSFLLGD